jgi:hypothetical protein
VPPRSACATLYLPGDPLTWANALPPEAWAQHAAGEGSKGLRLSDWASSCSRTSVTRSNRDRGANADGTLQELQPFFFFFFPSTSRLFLLTEPPLRLQPVVEFLTIRPSLLLPKLVS